MTAPPTARRAAARLRGLPTLILAQISLHAGMTGLRAIGPLVLLQAGAPAWQVGLLLACFGFGPLLIAWQVGHLVERHGYRRPMGLAIGLSIVSALFAFGASFAGPDLRLIGLCLAGAVSGASANTGMITLQRTAARMATDAAALRSQFAWVGLAPSASNVAGPLLAGVLLDLAGASPAMLAMLIFPLASIPFARGARTPVVASKDSRRSPGALRELLGNPTVRRMMLIDFLIFSAWDVHAVIVPILGHARELSATVIGAMHALFAAGVVAVRSVIPWLSHRLTESRAILGSLVASAAIFAVYPLGSSATFMGVCALALGATVGVAQPMIMASLHQAVDEDRRGSMLALRSMWINLQAVGLPVLFASAASTFGWAAVFWVCAGALVSGTRAVPDRRRQNAPSATPKD
jgi:MFS family permease